MTADLIALWNARDEARDAWYAFMEEGRLFEESGDDPVVQALSTPIDQRSEEQQSVISVFSERRTTLLNAVREAERRIRVATGHEKGGTL